MAEPTLSASRPSLRRVIVGLCLGQGWLGMVALCGSMLSSVVTALLAVTLGSLAAHGQSSESLGALARLAHDIEGNVSFSGAALVFLVVRSVSSSAIRVAMSAFGSRVTHGLRIALLRHLLGVGGRARVRRGDLATRMGNHVQNLQGFLIYLVGSALQNVLTIAGLGWIIVNADPRAALVVVLAAPLLMLLVLRTSKYFRRVFGDYAKSANELFAELLEISGRLEVCQAFGAEALVARRFGERSAKLTQDGIRADLAQASSSPVLQLVGALGIAGTLWLFGTFDPKALSSAQASFLVAAGLIYSPLRALAGSVSSWASARTSLEELDSLWKLPAEPLADRGTPPHQPCALEMRDVHFSYDRGEVLAGLSLQAGAGQVVALVGKNGAGKSTALALLLGLIDMGRGRIFIDGRDVTTMTRAAQRACFAWMPQSPRLFSGSLRDNITFGDAQPDEDAVREATRIAGLEELLGRLPCGLDTRIAEDDGTLSRGEAQRVSLARALYRRAPILLLDEPTASLDGEAASALGRTLLGALGGERTVLLVSHNLRLASEADVVLVLDQGRVVEQGSPAELWERNGEFRALFEDQFAYPALASLRAS